jgi:hypothetical protein
MAKKNDIFESMIAGGLIGAGLGALLSGKKEDAILGAIAGAAIMATVEANEKAREMNVPLYFVEKGKLYEKLPDGSVKFIRNIRRNDKKFQSRYNLK